MKKVIRSVLLLVLVLSLSTAMVPFASAASGTTQNKSAVYRFLTNTIGLNRAAASGVMANIEKESNFNPASVSVDSNGKLSGGLCQWNGTRFSSLKKYCSDNGLNYLSVEGQMKYLKKELSVSYRTTYSYMKGVSNTAQGAYDAGYYWCYYFEKPANKSSSSVTRGNLAKSYFNNFTPTGSVKKVTVSTNAKGGIVSLFSNLKISWTSGGEMCEAYIVEVARLVKGAYNWGEATGAYTTSKSYSFSAYELGKGDFAVRVKSMSDDDTKVSSAVKVKINCDHLYSSKVKKAATAKAAGERVYTCQYCGSKLTKTIPAGELKTKTLSAPKISASFASNATKLSFSGSKGADGYLIYVYSNGSWVKKATMPASTSSCKMDDVGKGAKLSVVAFKTVGSKTVKSEASTVKVK